MKRFLLTLLVTLVICTHLKAQLTIAGQNPSCYGFCNGAAQIINQGIGQYHYLWNTGDTIDGISGLCAGNYQCIVSDSLYLVIDTLKINLQQPAPLAISPISITNVPCYGRNNGYVRFSATGGIGTAYNFTWSTGYQGILRDSTIFNLPAGNYSISITDVNNCPASTSFSISQPEAITTSAQYTNATSCGTCNGTITTSSSGGSSLTFNYHWSTGATSATISGLCPGAYGLTVTDTTGCSAKTNYNIFSNQNSLTVSFSTATNIDCQHPGGFLFATPAGNNGPVQYLWSTGSTAPDIFNLPAGVYQVGVTDSSGCFATATDTIQNLGISIATLQHQDFSCETNSGLLIISPGQGTPPYTLHWSTGSTSDTLSGLLPGTYTVTVTDHANCSASKAFSISQVNNAVSLQATGVSMNCKNIHNGSAFVYPYGGSMPYTYQWNTIPAQLTDTATGLATGNYIVKVTDSFGCTISASVSVDSNYSQVTTSVTIGNCDSTGSATANLTTGTPPFTYLWSSQPAQTTATADSLYIGTYSVSVTDSTGCTRTGAANVQFNCKGYITGTVFYDINANCHLDGGENGIAGLTVLATNSDITFSGVTNLSGQYTIPITATGQYSIITAVNSSSAILQYGGGGCGYFEVCPASDTITFTTLNDTFPNHNFGFVGSSDFDLAIQAGWSPVGSNLQKQYWILYANHAFLAPYTDSATITFNYDPNLTFQSGIPAPVNDAGNHILTWRVDSIPSPTYLWADRVQAFFTVASGLPAGYQLKNSFHIEPYAGDCDTSNNSVYTTEIAGLSAVPISKEVYPEGDITMSDSILTYTIRFQNTGADSVHIVKITDSLSFWLDPQSVVNIASSPLFNQFSIMPGGVLTWVFNPAGLPDSATNVLASAGFVSFKAKFKAGIVPGATIQNKAQIFFDNLPPVATNTVADYIPFPVAVSEIANNPISVQIFPNPFNDMATVLVDGLSSPYDFELMDITGRRVKSLHAITTTRFQINRASLTPGVYIYGIYSNNQPVFYGKVVVE